MTMNIEVMIVFVQSKNLKSRHPFEATSEHVRCPKRVTLFAVGQVKIIAY